MSIEFLLTSLVVVVTPGTGALYTMRTGIAQGRRASVVAAFGCTLGILPQLVAAISGLAALLNAGAVAFQVIKYLGIAYLLYMAFTTVRDKGGLTVESGAAPRSPCRLIRSAILLNVLNPKLTVFFYAFLPQFVRPGSQDAVPAMVGLSAVFMALTFVVFTGYGWFAAAVRDRIISRPGVRAWLGRAFAGAFVAMAAELVFAEG